MKIEISGIKFLQGKNLLYIIVPLIAMLVLIGIVSGDVGVFGNSLILSAFIIAVPLFMMRYEKFREIKDMEEKFPQFLRDLVEAIRSGMPFHKAILAVSKLDYGRLNPEIKKMANQITWGLTIEKVLDQFAERMKRSKRMFSSIKIIRESYMSGGEVATILDSVADNVTVLGEAEKEKRSLLNQYVLMMYAISFVFLGIVIAINRLLVPIFEVSGTETVGEQIGLTNPCLTCEGLTCGVCDVFQGTSRYVFSLDPMPIGSYYTSLFFFMALIQSLFSGLVAGQISENSITAGIKHSVILVSAIFGSFSILVRLGVLGV